ncbi:MAG: hypothetical protein P4L40_24475 [Terracidiphilus sp.]|nr:hypothetical protein [Terracidiphilus sp.]
MHWLVNHLAQTQLESHTAQNVRMDLAESPSAHQQIDRAVGSTARRISQIRSRLHHDPRVGSGIGRDTVDASTSGPAYAN